MIITKKNLYVNGKCRFCQVKEHEKHISCYHGFRDMIGTESLDLEYMTDEELTQKLKYVFEDLEE